MQTYTFSAQQRRSYLRNPSLMRVSICRFSIPNLVELDLLHMTLKQLVAAHEVLRVRLHLPPHQRLPLLQLLAINDEVIRPTHGKKPSGIVRCGTSPADWCLAVYLLDDLHTIEIRCPTLFCDGYSLLKLGCDLAKRLSGHSVSATPASNYLQFAAWQRDILDHMEAGERDYWKSQRHLLSLCEPPVIISALPQDIKPNWESIPLSLSEVDESALLCAAQTLKTSLADLVLACWAVLLAQNQERVEICLGVTLIGRGFEPFREICGPISRTLPIRIEIAPTLAEMLPALRASLEAQEQWEDCFDWGLQAEDSVRFATGFRYLEAPLTSEALHIQSVIDADDAALVFCSVLQVKDRVQVQLDFDPACYPETVIKLVSRQLEILLRHVGRHAEAPLPERILHEKDRHLVIHRFNQTYRLRSSELGVARLFRQQSERHPDHIALIDSAGDLTYSQLEAWAEQLASCLHKHSAKRVGILFQPGAALVVAMLAALYAGKVFVPLDPQDPQPRRAHILSDSGIELLLTELALADLIKGSRVDILWVKRQVSCSPPNRNTALPDGDIPAYIVYTSGTTGHPKGVVVLNRALVNYTLWLNEALGVNAVDRGVLLTSAAYDLGYTALWGTLLNGGTLFLPSEQLLGDPHQLLSELHNQRVTFLKLTPSLLRLYLEVGEPGFAQGWLRMIVVGGEVVRTEDLQRLHQSAPHLEFVNHYGPTEATIGCIAQHILPDELSNFCQQPVLGRPISNTSAYILDNLQRLVPPGVVGEICIGGAGLSVGYLGKPELSAQRFVTVDEIGRVYRTGDLGFWNPDGQITFVGRGDTQIKIRGYRVEPDEIARVLVRHLAIEDAAVSTVLIDEGRQELIAFCVPSAACAEPVRQLCRLLQDDSQMALNWLELPDGEPLTILNYAEALFMYREIFVERIYLRHGIKVCSGDVVVDVGANIGVFALQVALEAPGARILSIEPAPAAFARLETNAKLYGDAWTCLPIALGANPGEAHLTLYLDHSLLSTLRPAADEDRLLLCIMAESQHGWLDEVTRAQMELTLDEQLRATQVSCALQTLSTVIRTHNLPRIDLLKIDAQRMEWDVLRGIEAEHWPLIQQVVLEVQDGHEQMASICSLLRSHGFHLEVDQRDVHAQSSHFLVYASRPNLSRPSATTLSEPSERMWRSPSALVESLRQHSTEGLPSYAVPTRIILLDSLPLTPNAKLSREALLAMTDRGLEIVHRLTAPTTELGSRLAELWRTILGVEFVGLESHFFELGGQSLLAAQLTNRIRDNLNLSVSLAEVLRNPRFGVLLALLESRAGHHLSLVEQVPWSDTYPLSHLQSRIWFLCQIEGGSEAYNLSRAFHLQGAVNTQLLQQATAALVSRHDSLRTRFRRDEMMQQVQPPGDCLIKFMLKTLHTPWDLQTAIAWADKEAYCAFDLTSDVLLRVVLVCFQNDDYLLVLTSHHIVSDGWSMEILINELFAAYARLRAGLTPFQEPLSRQHKDFIYTMNTLAEKVRLRAGEYLQVWSDRPLMPLPLPFDFVEPDRPTFRGRSHRIRESCGLLSDLQSLAMRQQVSPFCICVASLNALLKRWTGAEEIVLAATVSGRDLPGAHEQIGFFANTVLLREQVHDEDLFEDLIQRTSAGVIEALEYQHLALSEIINRVRMPRRHGMSALPAIGITWYEIEAGVQLEQTRTHCGFTCEGIEMNEQGARADLWFFAHLSDQMEWRIIYNQALFRPERIEALGESLMQMLEEVVRDPRLCIADLPVHLPQMDWLESDLDFEVHL